MHLSTISMYHLFITMDYCINEQQVHHHHHHHHHHRPRVHHHHHHQSIIKLSLTIYHQMSPFMYHFSSSSSSSSSSSVINNHLSSLIIIWLVHNPHLVTRIPATRHWQLFSSTLGATKLSMLQLGVCLRSAKGPHPVWISTSPDKNMVKVRIFGKKYAEVILFVF